jgi:pectin methylesterase-like acyl-CoA thioesterase
MRSFVFGAALLAFACGKAKPAATDTTGAGGQPVGVDDGGAGSDGAGAPDLPPGPDSLEGVTAMFPAPGGDGLCPDPPLRLTFSAPPTLGTAGKIQVFAAADPTTPVAAVDMAAAMVTDTIGASTFNMQRPVYVDGNDAVIYLKTHALGYGQSYFVTIDEGAIQGPGGTRLSLHDPTAWTFSTKAAAPAAPIASLTVSLDGSGDFCTVQGAFDALPSPNNDPVMITLQNGTYYEIVHFTAKNNVTLHGQDRKLAIIAGTNNNNLNGTSRGRSLVGADSLSGLIIENLTIHNLTPQNGSQAEALRFGGCDKCVVRDADILSLQDTVQWNGRIYASNCFIAGNVDFVWGNGAVYFSNCELKTVGRAGYEVQARNAANAYGYVFVDSKLTSDPGLAGNSLARIDATAYPASHVAYINCELGSHISSAGWTITNATDTSMLRFWEYQSVDPTGAPIDVSKRVAGSMQITPDQAAMMRDPTVVLGGWQPPL